jgi:hypothetical protein
MNDRTPIPLRADAGAIDRGAVLSLVRASITAGLGALDRTAARKTWPSDRAAELLVTRGPQTPTSTADLSAIGRVSIAFLAALTPTSAGAALLNRGLQLSFNGAASIAVPAIKSTRLGRFVAELESIPVTQFSVNGGPVLRPFKFASITTLSNEMLRSANAEALVRQALIESVGLSLDAVLFDDEAEVEGLRPAGLLHDIEPIATSGDMTGDLEALAATVASIAGDQLVFIADPLSAVSIALRLPREFPWPILPSVALAPGTIIALAANALVSASESAPTIEAGRESIIHMEDDAPAQIVDDAGTLARPVRSLFQSDTVGLKLRWPLSWALRDPAAIAVVRAASWTPAAPASAGARHGRR